MYINGWLTGYSEFFTEIPIELPENSSAEFIAFCLFNHMGIDMKPNFMESVKTNNDVEYWRKQYEEYTALYRSLEEAKDQIVQRMLEDFYECVARLEGVPPHQFKQIVEKNESAGPWKRLLKKLCKIFYILMCISFAVSVLFISCSFIKTDFKVNHSSITTKQVQPTQTTKPD